MSDSWPVCAAAACSLTVLAQSLGLHARLNFGAMADSPIRQSSISSPKRSKPEVVALLSQSTAARCSSRNRLVIQMMVTASRSAA